MFLNNCSFDNKTGIWKNENYAFKSEKTKDNVSFKDFKTLSTSNEVFKKKISLKNKSKINILPAKENFEWTDIYFSKENNLKNIKYNDLNQNIFKSKKLTRYNTSPNLIFKNGKVFLSDEKGNLIIYSIQEEKITSKLNFYKKKYKNIKKFLNLVVETNFIYISDNIGYLYCYNYETGELVWAINNKLPFKSNLKIYQNKIISSDVNNNLIFFNKMNGETLKLVPTENTIIRNNFINNISISENNTFFLNSFGTLYCFDNKDLNLKWFVNINPSLNLNESQMFNGGQIITNGKIVIVSSNKITFFIDSENGSVIKKFNFTSLVKPIINNNLVFFVTKNNFLICADLKNTEILYSLDINIQVAEYLKTKDKILYLKDLMLLNNDIFIFLTNSYIIKLKNIGEIKEIKKLPSKINSYPIVIDSNILFLNNKKKINIIN